MVINRHVSMFSKCLYQPGVPLEFPNVCMAMLFFQENKNLNFKTQVTESGHHLKIVTKYIPLSISIDQLVGYALGSKKEIYPRDGEKSNHHHHKMLLSSRKNGQLSHHRLWEFLLNSVKR